MSEDDYDLFDLPVEDNAGYWWLAFGFIVGICFTLMFFMDVR